MSGSDDAVLRAIAEGTAGAVGEPFFRQLVKHLASATGARHALVTEFAGSPARVRTLARWDHDRWPENVEYDLQGTPCEIVLTGKLCHFPRDVSKLFPREAELGLESYLGVPLEDRDGTVLGHLAIADTEPMPEEPRLLSVFRIFATRARAEVQRLRAEERLRREREALEDRVRERTADLSRAVAVLEQQVADRQRAENALAASRDDQTALAAIARAVNAHLDRASLFAAVAEALRAVVPFDRMGIGIPADDRRSIRVFALEGDADRSSIRLDGAFPHRGTLSGHVMDTQEPFLAADLGALDRWPSSRAFHAEQGMRSSCVLPLVADGTSVGILFFLAREEGRFDAARLDFYRGLADAVATALRNVLAHEEIARLRDRLAAENVYLREEIQASHNFEEIVGKSGALERVLEGVARVAPTDATVLVTGETGTGKELVARAVHARSSRRDRPLIKVSCATLPAGLVESELFGHEKGAFTGALSRREGRFELADGGTIFLDEIGELPGDMQAKLLRVLQEREFERVGGRRPIRTDVRVIAATNRDLAEEVRRGRFREDLFYRLAVFPIRIPPLRERPEDVRLLAEYFLAGFAGRLGKRIDGIDEATMRKLSLYDWPGNVRELENVIERAVILTEGDVLRVEEELRPVGLGAADAGGIESLEDAERSHILRALEETNWVVAGPKGAARILEMHPNTLRSRMKRLSIRKDEVPPGDLADESTIAD